MKIDDHFDFSERECQQPSDWLVSETEIAHSMIAPAPVLGDITLNRPDARFPQAFVCPHCGEIHDIAVHETLTDEAGARSLYAVAPSGAARTTRHAI
jgi:hypothetical protein